MGHLLNSIKPGMILVSVTPRKEPKNDLVLGEATKRELAEAKQMDGTHPVEKVLMVGDLTESRDALKVEVGDRVILNPFTQTVRIRTATGDVAVLVPIWDVLAIVGG
jgi:co-chaperonin GroES (HSP10)